MTVQWYRDNRFWWEPLRSRAAHDTLGVHRPRVGAKDNRGGCSSYQDHLTGVPGASAAPPDRRGKPRRQPWTAPQDQWCRRPRRKAGGPG